MSRLTILKAPGKTLTKSYGTDTQGRIVKTSYDNAAVFQSIIVEFDGIDGLAAVVCDLQKRPDCCVINAAPGRWNPGPGKPVLRRLYAAVELADDRDRFHKPARSSVAAAWQQGEIEAGRLRPVTVLPMFEETAVDHVFLDFDGVLMPVGIEWRADLDYTAAFLRLKLPAGFHGRRLFYYATGSAADPSKPDLGGDLIKMRLGFALDRSVTAAELKHWLAGVEGLDSSTLRPIQIIYTAAPRFRDGLADPLPERLGILDGDHERVAVPAIEMARTVRREAFSSLGPVRSAEGLGLLASPRMDAALERLAEAGGAAGGVRSALLQATFAYIRDAGRDRVDIDALAEALAEAAAPYRTEGEIAGYGIANLIAWAMEQAPAGIPPKPHYPARGLSAKEASAALQQEMAKAVGGAAAWSAMAAPAPAEGSIDLSETGPPPVIGIKAGAGVGKTDAVITQIAAIPGIEELNVEMYVPEHVLAAELAERVRKKAPGLRVIVIRGRGSADKPEQALCAKAGLAEPVARAGLNVMTTLCRSKGEGQEEECEFAGGCLFLAQFRDTGPAIRISAHAAMFTPRNQLLPTPHLVVVDESFWRNAAVHSRLPLDRLPEAGRWRFQPRKGEPRKKTEDRMLEAEDAAIRARNALLDGRDPRTVVSIEECKAVAAIEWGSRTGPGITPGQKLQEQMLRWSQWQQDECLKAGRFWDLLTGEHQHPGRVIQHIELERDAPTEEGDRRHILHLHHRRELKLPRVPIILLDADLSPIIAEKFTPGIRIVDIPVRQTVRVVQVHDRSCSKRFLLGSEAGDEADQRRAARRLDELRRTTERLLLGGGLLVTYKVALERLKLPPDVATLYVGNLRGRDGFKHLDTAVIAGRLEPSALLVERMARAIFGDDPEPLQTITPDAAGVVRYGTEQRRYRMTGGAAGPAVKVSVHPDPRAQAILEQIRECELLQAIARLRLVHRTKPATVYVLTNIPLDLEVTVLTTWGALARDRAAEACHRWDGVWLGSPSEQSRCAPDLWVTPAAAKQWAQEKGVSNRYKEYSRGVSYPFLPYPAWGCTALTRAAVTLVEYRLEKQRGSPHQAYVPGDVFCPHTARADLEAVTGPVAKLAIIGIVYRDRPGMLVSCEEPSPLDVPLVSLSPPVMLPIEAIFRFSTAAVRHPPAAGSAPRMAAVAGWHPFHLLSELSAGASA